MKNPYSNRDIQLTEGSKICPPHQVENQQPVPKHCHHY